MKTKTIRTSMTPDEEAMLQAVLENDPSRFPSFVREGRKILLDLLREEYGKTPLA